MAAASSSSVNSGTQTYVEPNLEDVRVLATYYIVWEDTKIGSTACYEGTIKMVAVGPPTSQETTNKDAAQEATVPVLPPGVPQILIDFVEYTNNIFDGREKGFRALNQYLKSINFPRPDTVEVSDSNSRVTKLCMECSISTFDTKNLQPPWHDD